MPYPNEHSARLQDPGKYDTCTRTNDKFGPGIDAIFCKKGDGPMELQAIRLDAEKFTVAEARKWLADHDHKGAFEAASETKAAFLLSLQTQPALSLAAAREENGVPVRRYRKELIKIGKYAKASDGIAFEVTEPTLDHWVATFAQWKGAGNKVPVPLTHRDPANPDQNRGWLVELFKEGGSLIGILDLVGQDADQLALTSDVSIYVPPEFTDGAGNVYHRPITHVALCTDPVIPGLKGFEAIAASLQTNVRKEVEMEHKKIAKALGLPEDLDATKAEALILDAAGKLNQKVADLEKAKGDLEKVNGELKLSITPKTPDPLLVKLASENRGMKLAALVAGARITPAVKDKLAKIYVEEPALALSLSKGGDNFDSMVAILAENDPVALREQTGPQILSLAGIVGADQKVNPIAQDVQRRRREAGMKD